MVAMSVLTFIIFGLYSMFDRTQKAFLESMRETDLQDAGRAFTVIMTRDLEQMHASGMPYRTNLYIAPILINGAQINGFQQDSMLGSNVFANVVQEFFFLTKTSSWNGIGYLMQPISTNANDVMLFTNLGVGALQRYATNVNDWQHKSLDLLSVYLSTNAYPSQRMTEGVMHLQLRPYDQYGNYLDPSTNQFTNAVVPTYLELEVAVLEPKVLLQARSIPNAAAQRSFLQETTNRSSAVHIYRTRFSVRAAN